MSEWAKVKSKSQEGKDWQGTANVPLGDDDSAEVAIRMLTEEERLGELIPRIDMESLIEYRSEGQSEEEERLQELQDTDELSDAEQAELNELHEAVAGDRAEIMSALGGETYRAIMDAGKWGIVPDEEDVDNVLSSSPDEQVNRFGPIDGSGINNRDDVSELSRSDAREALTAEMEEVLTGTPYRIKFTLGMQVFAESQGVGGNSDAASDAAT